MNENSGRRVGENPGTRAQISWRDSQTQRRHHESGRSDDSDGKYARLRSRLSSLVGDVVGDRECPIWTGGRRCNRRSREKSISDQNREWRFPRGSSQARSVSFDRLPYLARHYGRGSGGMSRRQCALPSSGDTALARDALSPMEKRTRGVLRLPGTLGDTPLVGGTPSLGMEEGDNCRGVQMEEAGGEWTLIRDPQLKGRQQGASQHKCRNCRDHIWSSWDAPRGAVARCGETWRDDHHQVAPPLRLLRALLPERTDLIRHSQLRGGHQLHPVCRRSTLPPHLLMHKWLRWDAHQTQTGLRSKSMRRRAPVRLTHTRREGACNALGGIT